MAENGGDRGVRHIVGRHVDRLHRGDGAPLGGVYPVLQLGHLGTQRRLVAHGGRHATQQAGDFAARLNEAKHIVDQQQYFLLHAVAQVLGIGERRVADAKPHAG